jgi:predicted Zn finger-like uncharacterized protein
MDVRCERCLTEYELEDDTVSEVGTSVQCTNCGHTFVVRRSGGLSTAPRDRAVTPVGLTRKGGGDWVVETVRGEVHRVSELTGVHRLIVERKVRRSDRLSRGGQPARPLEEFGDFKPFFDVVDEADRSRAAAASSAVPVASLAHPGASATASAAVPVASLARPAGPSSASPSGPVVVASLAPPPPATTTPSPLGPHPLPVTSRTPPVASLAPPIPLEARGGGSARATGGVASSPSGPVALATAAGVSATAATAAAPGAGLHGQARAARGPGPRRPPTGGTAAKTGATAATAAREGSGARPGHRVARFLVTVGVAAGVAHYGITQVILLERGGVPALALPGAVKGAPWSPLPSGRPAQSALPTTAAPKAADPEPAGADPEPAAAAARAAGADPEPAAAARAAGAPASTGAVVPPVSPSPAAPPPAPPASPGPSATPPPPPPASPPSTAKAPGEGAAPAATPPVEAAAAAAAPAAPAAPAAGGTPLYAELVKDAYRLQQNGSITRARRLYESALDQQPDGVEALTGMGYVQLDRNKFTSAISYFRRALSIAPHAPAMFGIGEAYRYAGEAGRAVEAYRRFLAQAPNDRDAPVARRQIRALAPHHAEGDPAPAASSILQESAPRTP